MRACYDRTYIYLLPRHHALRNQVADGISSTGFVVVAGHARGVNATIAESDGLGHESVGLGAFEGCTVENAWAGC